MPTIITGQRDTLNIETSQKKIDAEPKIALFDPLLTPLATALFTMGRQYITADNGAVSIKGFPIAKKSAINSRVDWWEDELEGFKSTAAGAQSSSTTTLNVADGTVFSVKDVLFNPRTGELFEVGAISTNALTVRRGVGNSGVGLAINDNDEIVQIGNVYAEGLG